MSTNVHSLFSARHCKRRFSRHSPNVSITRLPGSHQVHEKAKKVAGALHDTIRYAETSTTQPQTGGLSVCRRGGWRQHEPQLMETKLTWTYLREQMLSWTERTRLPMTSRIDASTIQVHQNASTISTVVVDHVVSVPHALINSHRYHRLVVQDGFHRVFDISSPALSTTMALRKRQ